MDKRAFHLEGNRCRFDFLRSTVLLTTGLVLALVAATAFGQSSNDNVSAIQQQAPSFLVRAEVNRESRDYREGDSFSLSVVSEVDAYVYVIYQQADGQAYQVFPNSAQQNKVLNLTCSESGYKLWTAVKSSSFSTFATAVVLQRRKKGLREQRDPTAALIFSIKNWAV